MRVLLSVFLALAYTSIGSAGLVSKNHFNAAMEATGYAIPEDYVYWLLAWATEKYSIGESGKYSFFSLTMKLSVLMMQPTKRDITILKSLIHRFLIKHSSFFFFFNDPGINSLFFGHL